MVMAIGPDEPYDSFDHKAMRTKEDLIRKDALHGSEHRAEKERADYRRPLGTQLPDAASPCGTCFWYQKSGDPRFGTCRQVKGVILAAATCDFWTPSNGVLPDPLREFLNQAPSNPSREEDQAKRKATGSGY